MNISRRIDSHLLYKQEEKGTAIVVFVYTTILNKSPEMTVIVAGFISAVNSVVYILLVKNKPLKETCRN